MEITQIFFKNTFILFSKTIKVWIWLCSYYLLPITPNITLIFRSQKLSDHTVFSLLHLLPHKSKYIDTDPHAPRIWSTPERKSHIYIGEKIKGRSRFSGWSRRDSKQWHSIQIRTMWMLRWATGSCTRACKKTRSFDGVSSAKCIRFCACSCSSRLGLLLPWLSFNLFDISFVPLLASMSWSPPSFSPLFVSSSSSFALDYIYVIHI